MQTLPRIYCRWPSDQSSLPAVDLAMMFPGMLVPSQHAETMLFQDVVTINHVTQASLSEHCELSPELARSAFNLALKHFK